MVSDDIALLIGRVILAWGQFDQRVYGAAITLQLHYKEPKAVEQPDDRFTYRLNLIRRSLSELTASNASLLAEFDAWRSNVKKLERKRAHLAHGIVGENLETGDGVTVYDNRELRAYLRADSEYRDSHRLGKRPWRPTELDALYAHHMQIEYTVADLSNLAAAIHQAGFDLPDIQRKARQQYRERENQPPPER